MPWVEIYNYFLPKINKIFYISIMFIYFINFFIVFFQTHFTRAKWIHHPYKVQCQPHHRQQPTCCHHHHSTIRPSISTWRRLANIRAVIRPSTWYKPWIAIQRHHPNLQAIGHHRRRVPIGQRVYNRRVPIISTYRVAIRPTKDPRPFTFDNESKKGVFHTYSLLSMEHGSSVGIYHHQDDDNTFLKC